MIAGERCPWSILSAASTIAWKWGLSCAKASRISGEDVSGSPIDAPTAQNVFNHAQRFDYGEIVARDVIFLTTLGCIPVLLIVSLLLI